MSSDRRPCRPGARWPRAARRRWRAGARQAAHPPLLPGHAARPSACSGPHQQAPCPGSDRPPQVQGHRLQDCRTRSRRQRLLAESAAGLQTRRGGPQSAVFLELLATLELLHIAPGEHGSSEESGSQRNQAVPPPCHCRRLAVTAPPSLLLPPPPPQMPPARCCSTAAPCPSPFSGRRCHIRRC